MALTANTDYITRYTDMRRARPGTVAAGITIYRGACVFMVAANGEFTNTAAAGANVCAGFADDNYSAAETAQAEYGHSVQITLTGVTAANVGDKVYATDDNTFTLSSTSTTWVGTVGRFITTNTCELDVLVAAE